MKYLSRNKVYHKVEASKDAKKIYIFCEGEKREIQYFKYFEGLVTNIEIIPIPNKDGLSDPTKLMDNAKTLFLSDNPHFTLSAIQKDEIWFVIDTDRWNENNKIGILREFCDKQNMSNDNTWFMAQSNPCFEIWLYYHFYDKMPSQEKIAQFTSFKQFVSTKIAGGFDNRSMPVEIESATRNSETNYVAINDQPAFLSTQVFNLGKVLLPYIKEQLKMILSSRHLD